jgi:hypothetical protein
MKQDKQTVLNCIKNMDSSKLHFVATDWYDDKPSKDQSSVERKVDYLKTRKTVEQKVFEILVMCDDFDTFDKNNKQQCERGANRSTGDIWRLYNNYFRPVTIFTIMRALWELVVIEGDVETLYCHDIDKQVFYLGSDAQDVFEINELGVRFAEWRLIGK